MFNPERKDEKLPIPELKHLVLTELELKEVPDMELRSRYYRLIEEAKRTQVELERRKLFAKDMFNIRNHTTATPSEVTGNNKQQQKIAEALAILRASAQAGSITKDQLLNKFKKGA